MPRSLLIVEDDPDQLDILSDLFRQSGYEVIAVRHPRQALEAATFRPFQVALLDQGLPELDGMQLMQELRHLHGDVQVVLLTGNSDFDFAMKVKDKGGFDCLSKPCGIRQIKATIECAFQEAVATSPPYVDSGGGSEALGGDFTFHSRAENHV